NQILKIIGTFVKSPCTTAGQRGTCEECDYGTFTEHDNHLQKCVDCAKCGPDQEVAEQCTNTQNTKCRCKAGRFCNPEEACEVCRKCLTCKRDEEVVRNCTFTSNTVCKKIPLKPGSSLGKVLNDALAHREVCRFISIDSPFLFFLCSGSSEASPAVAKSEEVSKSLKIFGSKQLPTLIPVNGRVLYPFQFSASEFVTIGKMKFNWKSEQSLRSCFEMFEELDVDFHKKFFRRLDFSDNAIKSKDNLLYEDKIHELLNSWVEREGKKANLNELLKVLVDLNQKRTAEKIMKKVLDNGHVCFSILLS
uniref:Hematopoietic death receptor n=1 Tax=Oryzias sinensis TaxID=183150 RepID=A0A8C7X5T3_9TELE